MCKLIEGNLKPFGFMKGEGLSCLAHSWLSNKHVLVAGDAGKVYLFEDAELKTIYNLSELVSDTEPDTDLLLSDNNAVDKLEKREITCLITYSGGFICSYGSNCVYVVEQQPQPGEEIVFKGTKRIVFPKRVIKKDGLNGYSVRCLCVSPSEDLLIALTDDLLLFSYQLKRKEGAQVKKNIFSIFLHPFHSAGVKGLDICHRKPLIVTGSDDKTIRIWNYRSPGIELAKKFREDIHSVAIHPDGLYVAAGFIDKIRFH